MNLGRKIVLVGVSAVGKSTFARELAVKVKLPVVHVDAFMWQSGWQYIGDDATVRELDRASSKSEWIIEGYISKGARQFILERADTIIYLDYPPMVAVRRYIQRWLKHRKTPRPELKGSPEKFSFTFLKLVWSKGETKSLDTVLESPTYQGKVVRLSSPKEARNFLTRLS